MDETDDNGDDDAAPPGGKVHMTPAGHRKLSDELVALRAERHRVVEIVAWAAGNGDRSENADYKEGKRRLREIDRRLRFLARRLANAEVVDPSAQTQRDRVFFGATVTYVGVDEADVARGTVSIASPIARALMRTRCGDEVTLRSPRGAEIIEVLEIRYP